MKEITAQQLNQNVFDAIGKQWMLISAAWEDKVNTMTASWGGWGVLWNREVATIYIRPQRYTKQLIDHSDTFSLCFFEEGWRKQLAYLGQVSGRDEPKIENAGLTVVNDASAPYFAQASLVILCRKLYAQPLQEACFQDSALLSQCYPQRDLHTMYIGAIERILIRE